MTTPTPEPAMSVEELIERLESLIEHHADRQFDTDILSALRALVAERRRGEVLREAAAETRTAQLQMRDHWSESDGAKKNELWQRVHRAGDAMSDALTAYDAPPPHPTAAEGGSR